jgi:hypothetical protein
MASRKWSAAANKNTNAALFQTPSNSRNAITVQQPLSRAWGEQNTGVFVDAARPAQERDDDTHGLGHEETKNHSDGRTKDPVVDVADALPQRGPRARAAEPDEDDGDAAVQRLRHERRHSLFRFGWSVVVVLSVCVCVTADLGRADRYSPKFYCIYTRPRLEGRRCVAATTVVSTLLEMRSLRVSQPVGENTRPCCHQEEQIFTSLTMTATDIRCGVHE